MEQRSSTGMVYESKFMAETKYIRVGRFIDGSAADVKRGVFLEVRDGCITDIGSAADLSPEDDLFVEDLSHCTVLPALVDCSVSMLQSPSVESAVRAAAEEAGLDTKTAILKRHIQYCHGYGVLGLVADDDMPDLMKHCRNEMEAGNIVDVRLSAWPGAHKGGAAGTSGGSGQYRKIILSGHIEEGELSFPHLELNDMKASLHRGGDDWKTVVVANGERAVKKALELGCDAIEQGYGMGEENLRKMAADKVLWIPSVVRAKNSLDGSSSGGEVCCRFSQRYVAPGKAIPGAETFWKKVLAEQLEQLRFAREVGVLTATGTGAGGAGILHGESMVEEIKLFMKAGYSLEEAICCASENGASFFGMNTLGALELGSRATFLATRGTVKQLPRKLSYLEGVYVDGLPSRIYQKVPAKNSKKNLF